LLADKKEVRWVAWLEMHRAVYWEAMLGLLMAGWMDKKKVQQMG
jgi:hypothetical protein